MGISPRQRPVRRLFGRPRHDRAGLPGAGQSDLRDKSDAVSRRTAMVVGIIIGASIFVQPSEITRLVPTAAGIALVWTIAGVLTMVGALICAELSSAIPRTGGVYVFLRDIFGPATGFLWGWAMFVSMHTGIIAAIAVVLARYVGYFVPLGPTGIRIVAVAAILGLSAFNCLGIRQGSRLQTIVTGAKLAAIAVLIIAGVALTPSGAG